MVELITVTITAVDVRGPYQGKNGEYMRHVYINNEGTEYFQFSNVDKAPTFKVGDSAKFLVESSDTPRGRSNKIIKANKITVAKGSTDVQEVSLSKKPAQGPKLGSSSSPGTMTPRDISIARMNAVTSAIALLTHNSDGQPLSMAEIQVMANSIIDYTTEPYSK